MSNKSFVLSISSTIEFSANPCFCTLKISELEKIWNSGSYNSS